MGREHRDQRAEVSARQGAVGRATAPGKSTVTGGMAPVQRKAAPVAAPARPSAVQVRSLAAWTQSVWMKAAHGFPPARFGGLQAGGAGQALPETVQAKMERSFNADFSSVRVHQDDQAASIGARAFTRGTNIHFASGEYDPGSTSGQELIGHELAHVVQQAQGRVPVGPQGKDAVTINSDAGLEGEADAQGARAARGEPAAGGDGAQAGQQITPEQLEQLYPPEHVRPVSIEEMRSSVVQPAWIGKRPLQHFPGMLGILHHKHIFFEDGLEPPNIGFLGPQGLGQDTTGITYTQLHTGLDDARMRQAVVDVGDPGEYHLVTNDCQGYVRQVLDRYFELSDQHHRQWQQEQAERNAPPPPEQPGTGTPPPQPIAPQQIDNVVDLFVSQLDTADRQGFRRVEFTLERTQRELAPGYRPSQQETPDPPGGERARAALRPLVETVARQAPSRNQITMTKPNGTWEAAFQRL